MTRSKSDAQLDAEAAVPLSELIRKHRTYYWRDIRSVSQMTTETPPVFINPQTGEPTAAEMSQIGPTLSWPLESFIASETRIVDEDGERVEDPVWSTHSGEQVWSKAAFRQWASCRRLHPEHRERGAFRGSLCKLLVGMVIRQGWQPDRLAYELHLDLDRVSATLRSALRTIDDEMARLIAKADRRSRDDAGRFTWDETIPVHHAVPGMHMQDCPQCRRSNVA